MPALGLLWTGEPYWSIEWLAARLAEAFPEWRVLPMGEARLPREAFDPERGQLVSPMVLAAAVELRRELGLDAALLVVNHDAYSEGLNFVFGEAVLGGRTAVVYTYRLRIGADRWLYLERLLKEALHELGHAFGLGHCSNPRCVMRFSNSLAEVDAKTSKFCSLCAARLAASGLRVSRRFILAEPGEPL